MYSFLQKLLGRAGNSSTQTASNHWSKWQEQLDDDKPRWIDWGEHPAFLELIYQQIFGTKGTDLFTYLKTEHPHFANCKALSLCSGDGAFENQLVQRNIFGDITGIDISGYRVQKARQQYEGIGNLHFVTGDINAGNYGEGIFDVVFAKAALHHIENLEAAFQGMLRCLRSRGYLVTIDFFGPTRFQWTDAQLELANGFLQQIPEQLRTTRDGKIKSSVTRPTIQEMMDEDPSEAARSAELHGFIQRHFTILKEFPIGGTVFARVFTPDIIGNFKPDDASHRQLIAEVFNRERELLNDGTLQSDFRFIIAEKRQGI